MPMPMLKKMNFNQKLVVFRSNELKYNVCRFEINKILKNKNVNKLITTKQKLHCQMACML